MKTKNYVSVSTYIPEENYEIAYAILQDMPFIGMEEKLDEIVLFFEEKDWNNELEATLSTALSTNIPTSKIINIQILPEKNWNEEWEKSVEPIQISQNIVITPEWKLKDFNCKHTIIINPKMSFGTGQHSTTKLMAIMIEKYLTETQNIAPQNVWIDAGTGTGVLAIIAATLGVKKIIAFDNDEWAMENAKENTELNNVAGIVDVQHCKIEDFDFIDVNCICANMFLGIIKNALPRFNKALSLHNGVLFVSGIMLFDKEELIAEASKNGFALLEEMQEQEWCAFKFGLNKNINQSQM